MLQFVDRNLESRWKPRSRIISLRVYVIAREVSELFIKQRGEKYIYIYFFRLSKNRDRESKTGLSRPRNIIIRYSFLHFFFFFSIRSTPFFRDWNRCNFVAHSLLLTHSCGISDGKVLLLVAETSYTGVVRQSIRQLNKCRLPWQCHEISSFYNFQLRNANAYTRIK